MPDPQTEKAVSVEGFVTIAIGEVHKFTLSGPIGKSFVVEWHAKDFDDAAQIGSINDMADSVATALVGAADAAAFETKIKDGVNQLKAIPGVKVLADIADLMLTTPIKVTDLVINTGSEVYEFGFGVDLRGHGLKLGNIELDAFGMRVTYAKKGSGS